MAEILLTAVEQIAANSAKSMRRGIQRRIASGEPVDQYQRAAIATAHLVQLLKRYPRLFHIEGIINREVVYALSDALLDAFIGDEDLSDSERYDLDSIAKYHAAALIGIMRSRLGEKVDTEIYAKLLGRRMAQQVVSVLMLRTDNRLLSTLSMLDDLADPIELHMTDLKSFEHCESIVRERVLGPVSSR